MERRYSLARDQLLPTPRQTGYGSGTDRIFTKIRVRCMMECWRSSSLHRFRLGKPADEVIDFCAVVDRSLRVAARGTTARKSARDNCRGPDAAGLRGRACRKPGATPTLMRCGRAQRNEKDSLCLSLAAREPATLTASIELTPCSFIVFASHPRPWKRSSLSAVEEAIAAQGHDRGVAVQIVSRTRR